MGVSIREKISGKGWWVNIRHKGRRTSKFAGPDKRAAQRLAKEVRLALAVGDLGLLEEPSTTPTPLPNSLSVTWRRLNTP